MTQVPQWMFPRKTLGDFKVGFSVGVTVQNVNTNFEITHCVVSGRPSDDCDAE
jgi:Na+-translocating ferredoxin:NAD+ oxidoreductase RnfC subunit